MSSLDLRAALASIPAGLLDPLLSQFEEGLAEYRAGDWEKVGLKAGKFCEIAYRVCEGHATGVFASAPSKPRNMFDACKELEKHSAAKGRSLCIQVPRVLMGLYELRNNRAIGHIGGDVDPNHMDAEMFLQGMKWVLAELVRSLSQRPVDEARDLVEAITAKTLPIVWRAGEVRRVLDPSRSAAEKVLILCYPESSPVPASTVQRWSEYKNSSRFRKEILAGLHTKALVHYDIRADTVQILPPGQRLVEANGLLHANSAS